MLLPHVKLHYQIARQCLLYLYLWTRRSRRRRRSRRGQAAVVVDIEEK